jgi:hypothetical protein
MQHLSVLPRQLLNTVLTSEELRVAALQASAKRGKWVARRRVFWRWLGWLTWSYMLPIVGLLAVITALMGFTFWQYFGHDAAYAAAQKWVQQKFGSFTATATATTDSTVQTLHVNSPTSNRSENASMINLTDEATPDLQIDRNLTMKSAPHQ